MNNYTLSFYEKRLVKLPRNFIERIFNLSSRCREQWVRFSFSVDSEKEGVRFLEIYRKPILHSQIEKGPIPNAYIPT